jgi:hypothetical protein
VQWLFLGGIFEKVLFLRISSGLPLRFRHYLDGALKAFFSRFNLFSSSQSVRKESSPLWTDV